MLAVSVDLLHGSFRADPDGSASTGRQTRGEWPPAPSRLFAAFVAADGTGERCRVTDGTELEWLERLPPPLIEAHSRPWHQTLQARYVVEPPNARHQHQEYVGRKGVLIRPGIRVTPCRPDVVYRWEAMTPPAATLNALRRRAARIGYLGAADSPVRVRVVTRLDRRVSPPDAFVPDPQGDLLLNVPVRGDVQILDRMYEVWTRDGASVSRSQFPALRHETSYRAPHSAAPAAGGIVVAWLRLDAAVGGRRIALVTALFKDAVLSKYQELHGDPPAVLHGHGFTQSGYELARFLALPDVGFERSRGRIHGLALWLPPAMDPVAHVRVRDAAFAVRRLTSRGMDVAVRPRADETRPVAANPDRWAGPSRGWVTAFPAIHERRRPLDSAEVSRWCRHAGLPPPIRFRTARTPLVRGAVDLAPVEVNRPGRPGLPYSHVELHFAELVRGPVVIGSGRQRGLGLCIPISS